MKKIHRFIIAQPLPTLGGPLMLTDRSLIHQLIRVLHLAPREELILCDGSSHEARAVIFQITPQQVEVELQPPYPVTMERALALHLYAALIRPELFELIVQKTTELGVATITPLLTERTVRTGFKRPRLMTIAKEAAELSGRGIVPVINEPAALPEVLRTVANPSAWFVADQGGGVVPKLGQNFSEVSLGIGPEGGWTDQERQLFTQAGIQAVSLGPTVLRAETAAIVGCFAVLTALQ